MAGASADPFAAQCLRALRGSIVEGVSKTADRIVVLRFAGGRGLVVELIPHHPTMALLDTGGRIESVAASVKTPPVLP